MMIQSSSNDIQLEGKKTFRKIISKRFFGNSKSHALRQNVQLATFIRATYVCWRYKFFRLKKFTENRTFSCFWAANFWTQLMFLGWGMSRWLCIRIFWLFKTVWDQLFSIWATFIFLQKNRRLGTKLAFCFNLIARLRNRMRARKRGLWPKMG